MRRRIVEPDLCRLKIVRITPAFISIDEAAKAVASLQDRLGEPKTLDLAACITWLARPTILPGWRWA
jgi:hypothetical protein